MSISTFFLTECQNDIIKHFLQATLNAEFNINGVNLSENALDFVQKCLKNE